MKQQQHRATFEDVFNAQDELITIIDECIEENKPLDKTRRKDFIKTFRLATLGIGSEYQFVIMGKTRSYTLKHVGHAAYWIAYRTSSKVEIGDDIIDIRDFWLKLRDMLFLIFDPAVETAVKISKEQTQFGTSEAAEV